MKRAFRRGVAALLFLILFISLSACGQQEQPQGTRPTEGVGVATVSAVGDVYLTDAMLADARQPTGAYDFSPQLAGVCASLARADLTVGNLEGTFCGAPYGKSAGSYPDELAAALSSAGFDLLQTANSYSIFGGLSGLQRTKAVISGNGMTAVGTYDSADEHAESPVVVREVNGVRIAFIAFTKGLGGLRLPENAEGCVNLLYRDYTTDYADLDTEAISSALNAAKEQSPDIIIALLHWGSENVSDVSEKQEEAADYLFDNGVDVIIGSHSHLVGTVERRTLTLPDGSTKEVVLAYSLGDFCAAEKNECNASLILNLEFTRNHADGTTAITDVSYTPIAALDRGSKEADRYAVIDIDSALALYESNYYDRIDAGLYETLQKKRETLLERLTPEEISAE